MGCRRVWALLDGLPPEAATWRGKAASWTVSEELTHAILDRILMQQRVKGKLPDMRPEEIQAQRKPDNVMSVSDFAAFYRQQQKGGEEA